MQCRQKSNYNTKIIENEIEKKITGHNHDKRIRKSQFNNLTEKNLLQD